ncbi:zinc finger (CCCH-type) family protein [Artemisia annua]|uniref:Zinc finger (CCCH-type) family protein n=1 Tax=Artemisia annua TaxID=35608 RepID=A0A2U1PRU0_ARTAN|nr:zinc finger (CCCH-type) family protein [Artemisia annua]
MDSFRDDGNVIHIIGGDDKPVSATGNEYDKAFGGTTSNLSYGGNAIAARKSIAIQKLLFKTNWCVEFRSGTCQKATNCNFAHSSSELRSLQQNYEDFGLANEHTHLLDKLRESFPQFRTYVDRSLKHCKKFYSEEGCPSGDGCPYVHDLESKYRERTTIVVSGGGSSSVNRDGRDTAALLPVAPPPVLAALPAWPQSAAPTPPVAPQPLPVAEADATVKPANWRTSLCKKWAYSGYCRYGSRCVFAHGEAELRRYGGALVHPRNQGFNVPKTVAAPGSSVAVAGGGAKLQGTERRSHQTTWKFPKKINGIYGDWIDDIQ